MNEKRDCADAVHDLELEGWGGRYRLECGWTRLAARSARRTMPAVATRTDDGTVMNRNLQQEITRRIEERRRALDDTETMRAQIEALAEVFEVDVVEVEAIITELRVEQVHKSAATATVAETLRR